MIRLYPCTIEDGQKLYQPAERAVRGTIKLQMMRAMAEARSMHSYHAIYRV